MPASSSVSRRTASSIDSPGSTKPARHDHMVAAKRPERPSRPRSPRTASMMATGSVRGKCSTLQAGQARFQPASTMSVLTPQLEQKRCRACQCSIALASASGGRCSASTRPWTAIERRSMTNRSSRAFSASALAGAMPMPKRAAPSSRPRNTVSVVRRERARLVRREGRIVHAVALLEHDHLAADDIGRVRASCWHASSHAASSRRSATRSIRLWV